MTDAFVLGWWSRTSAQLRKVSTLVSEAWIDGIYLTAWPRAAVILPIGIFLLGVLEGATHWTFLWSLNGVATTSAHVFDFVQMFPLLYLAVICGALSSQLGLLLVAGFALGDFFIRGSPLRHAPAASWNFAHLHVPQLISYLAFFLLAVAPTLTSKAMVASLPRWLRRSGTPYLAFAALLACAIQGLSVHAWTLAVTMIVRVHWLWGRVTPPFAVFDFSPLVNPSLPVAAMIGMAGRFCLSFLARRKLNPSAITAARQQTRMIDRHRASSVVSALLSALGTALVTTALISGLFDSITRGLAVFAIVAALFLVRDLVLLNALPWKAWSRLANHVPLLLRWAGAILAAYGATRWILSSPRFSARGNAIPGAFGAEIFCFLVGLVICVVLLPAPVTANRQARFSRTIRAGAKVFVLLGVLTFAARHAVAGICLDPFCCFGGNNLLAALVVAAFLWEAIPFLLMLGELAEAGVLGDMLFNAVMAIAPETADSALLKMGLERLALMEEESVAYATRAEARQAFTGAEREAADEFFKGATGKSIDFQSTPLSGGGQMMQYFSPANNPGYGKLYVQYINEMGEVLGEYKLNIGPGGVAGTLKWVHQLFE